MSENSLVKFISSKYRKMKWVPNFVSIRPTRKLWLDSVIPEAITDIIWLMYDDMIGYEKARTDFCQVLNSLQATCLVMLTIGGSHVLKFPMPKFEVAIIIYHFALQINDTYNPSDSFWDQPMPRVSFDLSFNRIDIYRFDDCCNRATRLDYYIPNNMLVILFIWNEIQTLRNNNNRHAFINNIEETYIEFMNFGIQELENGN